MQKMIVVLIFSADGSTLPPPTGTTVDTCVDSGDLDCKQMNDTLHLCEKKNSPPTLLYCPKFCGLCTPVVGGTTKSTSIASGTPGADFPLLQLYLSNVHFSKRYTYERRNAYDRKVKL